VPNDRQFAENTTDMPDTISASLSAGTRSTFERAPRWTDGIEAIQAIPPPVAVAHDATLWLFGVDEFREGEAGQMREGRYEATLATHRLFLTQIIADGERLMYFARKFGLPKGFSQFSVNDLEATLESLHITFRTQHGPKNHPQRAKAIESLLDAT